MAFLHLQQVSYHYSGHPPVVRAVDWELARGEFHCLVGRSGCGKTTLLKLAAGLLQAHTGQVMLAGQRLLKPGPALGFVFQSPTLLEWRTVLDNVLLPISLQRTPDAADLARAQMLLELMGIASYADRYPPALSGGQQSRVALARALVLAPSLLLLDEPFAALDAITREELQDDLLRLCALGQTSVLFVTHDIHEAVYLADRVAVMTQGQISHDIAVPLPRPRRQALRYEPPFNALCARVRHAMDGGAT
jgi:NitT/TauT family transport system ATP-binding protein